MEIEVVKVDLPPLPDPPRLVFERPGKSGGRPRLRVTDDLVAALVAVLERTGSYGCAAEWCGVSEDWLKKLVAAEPLDLPDVHGVARKLVRARAKRRIQLVETLGASTCKIQSANAQFLLGRLAPAEFAPPKAPPTPPVPPQPVRVEFVAAPAPPAAAVAPTAPAAAPLAEAPAPPPKPTRPPTAAVPPAVAPPRPAPAAPKPAAPAPARPAPVVLPRPAVPPAKPAAPRPAAPPPRPGAPR